MLSHPFPVERLRYLQEVKSEGISPDSSGNYQQSPAASEERLMLKSESPVNQVTLRRQIEIATGN